MIVKKTKQLAMDHTIIIEKKSIIEILENAIDTVHYKDEETNGHMNRLGILSEFLWNIIIQQEWIQTLDERYIEYLWMTAPLHDIWKLWIPYHILTKPWKLTAEEYDVIKTHPIIGWEIIEDIRRIIWRWPILEMAQDISLYHHEKYDGSWYPYWLQWKQIPLAARIVAIIDVLDVLKSRRIYKENSFDDEMVYKIINEWRWTHFDPDITDIVLENLDLILKKRDKIRENVY